MFQTLTFIWGQPPSAKSQSLLETLCCLLPHSQPLSWSQCTRTTPHLMGGWKGRSQGREENLQVNISDITQPHGDPQSFAPSAPSAHGAPVSLPPQSINYYFTTYFSIFLPPLQLWYPILVPVSSSHQGVAMASSVPHLPSK